MNSGSDRSSFYTSCSELSDEVRFQQARGLGKRLFFGGDFVLWGCFVVFCCYLVFSRCCLPPGVGKATGKAVLFAVLFLVLG